VRTTVVRTTVVRTTVVPMMTGMRRLDLRVGHGVTAIGRLTG
jgi:hypothetical protein